MKAARVVVIESPYAGDIAANLKYARLCMASSLGRNEAPFASHLLYTQEGVLDDSKPEERKLGIEAGFAWKLLPGVVTVFYVDKGWSGGMLKAHKFCIDNNLPFEIRRLWF